MGSSRRGPHRRPFLLSIRDTNPAAEPVRPASTLRHFPVPYKPLCTLWLSVRLVADLFRTPAQVGHSFPPSGEEASSLSAAG